MVGEKMISDNLQNIINILESEDQGDVLLGIEFFKRLNRYDRRRIINFISKTPGSKWRNWGGSSFHSGNSLFHTVLKTQEGNKYGIWQPMLSIKV